AMHTGFMQVALNPDHATSSFDYIKEVRQKISTEMPELQAFFSTGSLVDGVLNMGSPVPIDVRITGTDMTGDYEFAQKIAAQIRGIRGVADVYIPQDIDYPSLRLTIDRTRASELGLTEKEVVSNVITALTSNQMVAPSIWVDPKNGNNYWLTVQYPERQVRGLGDLQAIPLHGAHVVQPTRLDMVSSITPFQAPTE